MVMVIIELTNIAQTEIRLQHNSLLAYLDVHNRVRSWIVKYRQMSAE